MGIIFIMIVIPAPPLWRDFTLAGIHPVISVILVQMNSFAK